MKEHGIIILEDGNSLPFGKYICPSEPEYMHSPTHESAFDYEVRSNPMFKFSDHIYNEDLNLYQNALLFSLEGVITIFNNQQSPNSPTKILAYVPTNPTEEQLKSLKENETLLQIQVQNVYSFNSYDFDDSVEYEGFNDYINKNTKSK